MQLIDEEVRVLTEVHTPDLNLCADLMYTDGKPESYPRVIKLMADIDTTRLHQEYQDAMEVLKTEPIRPMKLRPTGDKIIGYFERYFLCHDPIIGHPPYTWMPYKDCIGSYTREILSRFKSRLFRPQYTICKPGFYNKPHIDHYDNKRYGFRCFIPIICSDECTTTVDKVHFHYDLGYAWFLNVGKLHTATNDGTENRICIMLDLLSDVDVYEAMMRCD